MFKINWNKKAVKQLAKVDGQDRTRIANAVSALADLPNAQNVKALTNHAYGYRLRVGNYRVLFDADTVIRIVEIQEVKKRDDNTY
ncbi:type II toxin-antitoxin system RelE family toxin [Bordetella bronchiseptica]|uniref:type II toxin-antitoxin system RelE family toxin n=1 Tax=Bordetella bronchiseptica TaxID=518 RepID=UPI000460EC58|nr:type II toxin-antitoxin system RelE/ParE family toxin [Bordetella bronchiseptica]KDD42545.1 plasmid stabilization system protein, RelE/ParE family [Bordetella bronchiseptica MBORD901]